MKKKYNKNSKLQGPIQKEESPEKMTNIKCHDKQWSEKHIICRLLKKMVD